MDQTQQGEIWRVKLGRRRRGTELRAHDLEDDPEGERFCLIVSADDYNDVRKGLTVVPFTSYTQGREEVRPLWSVAITNRDDINFDPRNARHQPRRERLPEWLFTDVPYKSIIDCGQLWTVNKLPKSDPENDLRLDYRFGELKETKLIQVDSVLQAILGGCIRYTRQNEEDLRYQCGDVLELELPELGLSETRPRRCLVVSSTGIDILREQIIVLREDGKSGPLGHCTIVPLISAQYRNPSHSRGVASVDVYPTREGAEAQEELALCQEIYTVDWRSRSGRGSVKVGEVHVDHMNRVRYALRDYLDLPA